MTDVQSPLAAAAWERIQRAMADAATVIAGPLGARTPRELAEGYRHLAGLVSLALESWVEHGDPLRPEFTRWMTPFRKVYGDNPWTIYDSAQIEGASSYEIVGDLAGPTYLGICVYGKAENGDRRIITNIDDVELVADADGTVTVTLVAAGAKVPGGARNVVQLEADANEVMIRQYFVARALQGEASYTIARTPGAGTPEPMDDATIAGRLDLVAEYIEGSPTLELTLSALMASATPGELRGGDNYDGGQDDVLAEHLDAQVITRLTPSPAIQYTGSWIEGLRDDEMIVIAGNAPACRFWSIQLMNRFMESLDFVHQDVYATGEDLVTADDGSLRIVIAKRDTGDANFLTTTGLDNVHVAMRAINAEELWDVSFTRTAWIAA